MDPTGTGELPNRLGFKLAQGGLISQSHGFQSARTGQGQIATGGQIVARS
jgi:hypothetical protein